MPRRTSPRDCARALWLLGIEPPVTSAQLQAAYRARIAQAHPDLHLDSEARTEAANVLSRAINEARDLVSEWIAADRDWPALAGSRAASRSPAPPDPMPAPVCRRTGLRAGDLVRVWPYDGDVEVVAGTEIDREQAWVILRDRGAVRARPGDARRVPVPGVRPVRRPGGRAAACCDRAPSASPTCAPSSAGRTRRAGCEAPSRPARRPGLAEARVLRDERLEQRAESRRRWARGLRRAGPDDLRAALVSAFTNAFDRWTAPV